MIHSLFADRPRSCKCGTKRVDRGDRVLAIGVTVLIHGIDHCYSYMREQ